MSKRVFIIHGWGSSPKRNWKPWLKRELDKKGYKTFVPVMPDTNHPKIEKWINNLSKIVGIPDSDCYFIGHSIGCQTILRYLETLQKDVKVGGVIFVAGWFHLNPDAFEEEGDEEIANPWLKTPIRWNKITTHTKNFVAIFSDNDPLVPIEDAGIFKERLGAKVIFEHKKGHFAHEDGIMKLPIVLESIIKMSD
ncbi:MAG: serine hydrolase family protein [Candidatus Aenigmarchaeota archaeon]|nr:serine hydrolase family protein [Candidatus Aenigmarchaeota archaeon]